MFSSFLSVSYIYWNTYSMRMCTRSVRGFLYGIWQHLSHRKKRALSISEKARSMTVPSLMPPERIIFFLPGGTSSHAEALLFLHLPKYFVVSPLDFAGAVRAALVCRVTDTLGVILPGAASVDKEPCGKRDLQIVGHRTNGGHIPSKQKPIVNLLL